MDHRSLATNASHNSKWQLRVLASLQIKRFVLFNLTLLTLSSSFFLLFFFSFFPAECSFLFSRRLLFFYSSSSLNNCPFRLPPLLTTHNPLTHTHSHSLTLYTLTHTHTLTHSRMSSKTTTTTDTNYEKTKKRHCETSCRKKSKKYIYILFTEFISQYLFHSLCNIPLTRSCTFLISFDFWFLLI